MNAEIKEFKSKKWTILFCPVCFALAVLCYLLINPVNNGGSSGANLIFILVGIGLVIISVISLFFGICIIIMRDSIEIGEVGIKAKRFGKDLFKINFDQIEKKYWNYILYNESKSLLLNLPIDIYNFAIKPKGLCLDANNNQIFLEKYRCGIWRTLRDRIADKVPTMAIMEGSVNKVCLFLLFDGDTWYFTKDKITGELDFQYGSTAVENSLVKLSTDNEGNLFLKILEKCSVKGLHGKQNELFEIKEDSSININTLPEYEVSKYGFEIEGVKIQTHKFR